MSNTVFITEVVGAEGVIEADRLSEMLRITKGELASVTGLSRDSVSKTARLKAPATQSRLRGDGRDHQSGAPMGGLRASGVRLVPVATDPLVRRTDRRSPGQGRSRRGSQTLPRSDRRRRICVRLTGLVYRAHNPRWSFAPMSGRGAALYGGRFNPVGMEALYTSLQVETAWREAQQGFAFKAQPLTICAYRVDCDDIADLRDPSVQGALAIDPNAPARGRSWSRAG